MKKFQPTESMQKYRFSSEKHNISLPEFLSWETGDFKIMNNEKESGIEIKKESHL